MKATILWLALLLVAATGTSQAMLDQGPDHVYPQDDGGSGQDASDVCAEPSPEVPRDERQEGQLVPLLDHDDVWAIPADAGEHLTIEVQPRTQGQAGLTAMPVLTVAFSKTTTGGCDPPLAQTTTDGQEPATFQVEVHETGIYSLQIHLDGFSTSFNGDRPDLVVPLSGHCSPVCVADMDLLVTQG